MTDVDLTMDMQRLEAFVGGVVGNMIGAGVVAGVVLGEKLGLYRAMAGAGAMTADALATASGCNRRLIREWLDGQAAAGHVVYDAAADTYALPAEHAMVLADEDSPAFLAGGLVMFQTLFTDVDRVAEVMRGNGGMSWGDHHESLFPATARFFRPGYKANLIESWIPALDGVEAKLRTQGGRIADVGCGFGHSATIMAKAYPKAEVVGFDFHAGSIEAAREHAGGEGLDGRVRFEVAKANEFTGSFDLICFFDCLHDMGDPVGIARHAAEQLAPGGTILLVEPFALDGRAANIANPPAAMFYVASTFLCTPNSLSQEVGRGLGAQCGEVGMRAVFDEAGFTHFRRATETPFNIVYEARR